MSSSLVAGHKEQTKDNDKRWYNQEQPPPGSKPVAEIQGATGAWPCYCTNPHGVWYMASNKGTCAGCGGTPSPQSKRNIQTWDLEHEKGAQGTGYVVLCKKPPKPLNQIRFTYGDDGKAKSEGWSKHYRAQSARLLVQLRALTGLQEEHLRWYVTRFFRFTETRKVVTAKVDKAGTLLRQREIEAEAARNEEMEED